MALLRLSLSQKHHQPRSKPTKSQQKSFLVSNERTCARQRRHYTTAGSPVAGPVATVFGCTGFLGPWVVDKLARRGVQVVVPYRGEEKEINVLKPMGEVGQIIPMPYNIRDQESIERAMLHSNIVINLVAKNSDTKQYTMKEANIESARRIATAAKKRGVDKFIHMSCVGADVYSNSAVFATKGESEEVVFNILPEATVVRSTHLFGPGDRFINKFGKMVYRSKFVPCPVPKHVRVQPVYAADVAAGIDKILASRHSEGKIFELGGPHTYTIEDMIIGCLDAIERGNTGYFTGGVVQLPPSLARLVVTMEHYTRVPYWVLDELKSLSRDVVVPPTARFTFRELDIKPTPMENIAHVMMQLYKIPTRFLKE